MDGIAFSSSLALLQIISKPATRLIVAMIFFAFVSALIFVSHGVGEHCSRYEEFGSVLAKQGFLVVSHDHGKFFICLKRMNCPSCLYVPGRGEGKVCFGHFFAGYVPLASQNPHPTIVYSLAN